MPENVSAVFRAGVTVICALAPSMLRAPRCSLLLNVPFPVIERLPPSKIGTSGRRSFRVNDELFIARAQPRSIITALVAEAVPLARRIAVPPRTHVDPEYELA